MDRILVQPYEIPTDTMFLATNKNALVALGYALEAILGSSTLVDGLVCTPTTPASLNVLLSTGSIYSFQNIDNSAYGTIAADTSDQIVKQGIVTGNTTLACPAPTTSGQSINYLVQAIFQESDGGAQSVQFYNVDNPAVPLTENINTVRQGQCIISLKAGTSATTGTQTTPAPDSGYVGLYAITVANGQSTIVSGNIAQLPTAPFIGGKLTSKLTTIKRTVITANATYTPSNGLLYALVEVQAPGGGGGAIPTTSGTQGAAGSGGSAGGYASKWLTAAAIGASQSVLIGAAGAGGAIGANSGANAGNCSFGSLITANGGQGGGSTGAASGISGTSAATAGGTSAGGDLNVTGGAGSFGIAFGGSTFGIGGTGGTSRLGIGGAGGLTYIGANGTGFGAGGGGSGNGSDYNGRVGGNGAPGAVIITEYCSQ